MCWVWKWNVVIYDAKVMVNWNSESSEQFCNINIYLAYNDNMSTNKT